MGASDTTAAANRELIRHIMEDGFNKADMSVVYDSFVPEYKRHGHGVGSMASLEEHVADLGARHAAFTNARFKIDHLIANETTVAVKYTFWGTHTADYAGIAATGKEISRPSSAFFTVVDGKVTEGHVFADGAGLIEELKAP